MSVIILISQFSIKVLISLRSQDNPNLRKKMAFLITSRCPPLCTYNIPIYESIYSTPGMKHNKVSEKCTKIFRPRIFNLRKKTWKINNKVSNFYFFEFVPKRQDFSIYFFPLPNFNNPWWLEYLVHFLKTVLLFAPNVVVVVEELSLIECSFLFFGFSAQSALMIIMKGINWTRQEEDVGLIWAELSPE